MVLSRFLPPRFHMPLFAAVVAVSTYLAAKIGGVLIITAPQTLWPLWPGCAVLVAVLLISPRKLWPIFLVAGISGFVVYDLQAGVPLSSIFWLILTDVFEILIAAGGVSYFFGQTPRLDNLKSFTTYVFFTVLLGPFVAAVLSAPSLHGDRWISLRSNFISEGFAFLTITPAILGWVAHGRAWLRNRRGFRMEGLALFLSLSALCYLIFITRGPGGHPVTPALLYSLVPFLLWAALRFGYTGAGTAASIVALISIWGAIHGRGPFTEINPIHRVLTTQLFLWCSAVPFMVLAVLVEERRQQASVLRESEERFRLMADTAPTLIWMSGTNKLCTFFNHGWLAFTGRTLEQELGEGWADGVHPADLDRCLAIYSGAFDSRMNFVMEYRLRRHDGEYRWIVDYGVPRFGSNGDFLGYIGSCIDITERKLSEMSLHELSGRLIRAQEEECARIARELHDDISQRMAFLQIGLDQFEQTLGGLTANEKNELHNLVEVASEVSSDLHNISHRLHPARLDLQGLVAAARSFCQELSNQQEIEIKFVHQNVPPQLPSAVALCLFRIIQEALRNVVKHARANQANVVLTGHSDRIDLSISDDGAGFQPANADSQHGLGLISMRERLRLIDGHLIVDSSPTHGTQIQVQVPLTVTAPSEATSQPKSHKATA
jgi:PAS domain S-box-containing protein